MSRSFKYAFCAGMLALLAACGSARETVIEENGSRFKEEELLAVLDRLSDMEVGNFYSKINTQYKDSARNVSFKTSLRIANDSAVSAIISYASIPVVNALITPDSVKISNRKDKCYLIRDLAYFREQFGVDFSYENIEELLLGKPVAYKPDGEYFKASDAPGNTVCSHKKRDIRKNERNNVREIITYYTLDDSLHNLSRMQIISPEDSTMIEVSYLERELLEGYELPLRILVDIFTPRQQITVDFEYRKSHINKPEEIHFVIPENYEKCN
jgi:hypothetical protein